VRGAQYVIATAALWMAATVTGLWGVRAAHASARSFYHGTCQVGSLAAPGDPGYGPYSADYYAPQFSYGVNAPVHLVFAAYAPVDDPPPTVVSFQVLKKDFTPLLDQPYAVRATGCQQNQAGPQPTTSLFTYSADWTTPSDPTHQGMYYLSVSFQFADGTLVEYFANITVRDPPETITGGSIHWETWLSGIGYQQASAAYNLFSPGASDTVTAHTSFYFDANPATVCDSDHCGPGSASTTVIRGGMDNNLESGNVFLLGTPPHVPYYKDGWDRQSQQFTFSQDLGGVSVDDTGSVSIERGSYTLGGHVYRYHVEIDEPFLLRSGGVTFVHAGSYVLDNGITGPAGWQGTADNLGEGQGFRFYVNPSTPEPPATTLTVSAPSTDVTLSRYDVVPSGAVEQPNGAAMAWQYEMHVYKVACPSTSDLSSCTVGVEVAGSPHRTTSTSDTWTGLPAGATGTGDCYWPQLRVNYIVKRQLHLSSDLVPAGYNLGDYNNVFCLKQASAPPTDTSTTAPTVTATPAPTNTATPVPPTATPTPARGDATLAQTVVPYAWVRSAHAEDPAAQDRLYASPWGHNPDPSTFYWPVGRPLHLLPAVDEDPAEAHLTIDDLGNGGSAVLYAESVTATDYTLLDAGALGSSPCLPSGSAAQPHAYTHDPRYPAEVDPFSPRVALVWAPATLAGTLPATTIRCDVAPLLDGTASGPATLTYRIHETLIFAARFAALASSASGVADCVDQLAPLPAATPFSAESGVPAPAPAFTAAQAPGGPCVAATVGLAAARQALDHWRTEVSLADPAGALTDVAYTATGTLLRITVTVERTVALHYHLLVSREVAP